MLDRLDILYTVIHHLIVTRLCGQGGIQCDPDLFTRIMYVNNDHTMASKIYQSVPSTRSLVWQSIRNEGRVNYRCDIYILPLPNHLIVWWLLGEGLWCLYFDFVSLGFWFGMFLSLCWLNFYSRMVFRKTSHKKMEPFHKSSLQPWTIWHRMFVLLPFFCRRS